EQFVQHLTESQNRLYGYIYSLLGSHSQAADVVQETNLVLWRKIDEFDSSRPFLPWAFGIARFQVLANLRDKKRDRVLLDADLAETLCEEVASASSRLEDVREALRGCLEGLPQSSRELIFERYTKAASVADIANTAGRSISAVKVALMRARRQLAECVDRRMAAEGYR
ncbi:MAG: sigma-70 family RNA polymerase sigma factor, partial [Planctomycetaceae bacterium]